MSALEVLMDILVIRQPVSRDELRAHALDGELVKAVVDVTRGVMAIGGELHADEEAVLLREGSEQQSLWGINLYPDDENSDWIEFDSMINLRPSQGNRSRNVCDAVVREEIRRIVASLVRS